MKPVWIIYYIEERKARSSTASMWPVFQVRADSQDECFDNLPPEKGRPLRDTWYPRKVEVALEVDLETELGPSARRWLAARANGIQCEKRVPFPGGQCAGEPCCYSGRPETEWCLLCRMRVVR